MLEMPWNLTAHMWKKTDRGFPNFDSNPDNLHDITNNELWNWKKLFWSVCNKKQILINRARWKIALYFYSFYGKLYYKIIVIWSGDQVCQADN